jgi:hypothetical protein
MLLQPKKDECHTRKFGPCFELHHWKSDHYITLEQSFLATCLFEEEVGAGEILTKQNKHSGTEAMQKSQMCFRLLEPRTTCTAARTELSQMLFNGRSSLCPDISTT